MVINQAVVRKIVHNLKFAILANDRALTLQNVMLSFIVQITTQLILAAGAVLPFLDFGGKELKFCHAGSPTLNNQAIDPIHSVIQKHSQSPFLLLNKHKHTETVRFSCVLLLSCY